jgi:nitrate reductase gamma subunit
MRILLVVATYVGYIFIVTMYTVKIVKYLKLPLHLRSEIYPVRSDQHEREEKSYLENLEWWTKPREEDFIGKTLYLIKEYFLLSDYFRWDKGYWLFLYPWHIGFILIITFHILSFLGAFAELLSFPVGANSPSMIGSTIYYLSLGIGVTSFVAGLFGSIGIMIKRLADEKLRDYATPLNYFTYFFLLAVFLTGLYSWNFADPSFHEYRAFWKGLITFKPIDVQMAASVHVLLFALLLIYLPFTRSLHYVTRFFGFFLIRWDDKPNLRGSKLEKEIEGFLERKVTWRAPHVRHGKSWRQNAVETFHQDQKGIRL